MTTPSTFAASTTTAVNSTLTITREQWHAYTVYTLFDNKVGSEHYLGGMILFAVLLSTIALIIAFVVISKRPLSREPTDQELQEALNFAQNEDIEKQLKKAPKSTNGALPKDFAFSTGNEEGSIKTAKTKGMDNADEGPDSPAKEDALAQNDASAQNDAPAKDVTPAPNSAITPPELISKSKK